MSSFKTGVIAMRAFHRLPATLACLLLIAGSRPVLGADGVNISVTNNTTDDLRVTVYDLNTHPAQKVLMKDVINGFATLLISITPDESGHGHLSWKATTVGGGSMRRCGRHDNAGLKNGDDVHIYANAECDS
jgi:hypothetical protein